VNTREGLAGPLDEVVQEVQRQLRVLVPRHILAEEQELRLGVRQTQHGLRRIRDRDPHGTAGYARDGLGRLR
jgi:hypothetical protein